MHKDQLLQQRYKDLVCTDTDSDDNYNIYSICLHYNEKSFSERARTKPWNSNEYNLHCVSEKMSLLCLAITLTFVNPFW